MNDPCQNVSRIFAAWLLASAFGWADEFPNYNYAANTCASGQQCGHYTQMVWRTSTQVGCASVTCSNGKVLVVCNYSPAGNTMGQKAY